MFKRYFSTINNAKDYYLILGITRNASQVEIKRAYIQLAKKYHPDSPTGSSDLFRELAEAYEILGKELTRSDYDSLGRTPIERSTRPNKTYKYQDFQEFKFKKTTRQRHYKQSNETPKSLIVEIFAQGLLLGCFVMSVLTIYKMYVFFKHPQGQRSIPLNQQITHIKIPERKAVEIKHKPDSQEAFNHRPLSSSFTASESPR